ncbi:MAG TPA: CHAT domain-containing protein [Thermoanaerobaculia bacterium]|nr:CHAT domain-containing protein [Thermoanaerobaculia bacterium]
MAELDFLITFFADQEGGLHLQVQCPFGAARGRFSFSNLAWPEGPMVADGARADELRELGTSLFDEVFHDRPLALFFQTLGKLAEGQQLRIQIRLALDDPDLMRIHELPWELLYSTHESKFLALDRRFSIVRYLEVPGASQPLSYHRPMRILCVAAEPKGQEELKIHDELAWIERAWARPWRRAKITTLGHASLDELRTALIDEKFHLLHFLGHGEFDPGTGDGVLLFEDDSGKARRVTGEELAEQVADRPYLRGVFLNACWTAKAGRANPFSGVATALVRAGVPAVLGMQFEISDAAARVFSQVVYQRLAAGESVDAAVVEGRLAIRRKLPQTFEWATPALFLRTLEIRPPRRRRRPLWFALGVLSTLLIGWLFTWGPLSCPRQESRRGGPEPAPASAAPRSDEGTEPKAPIPSMQRTTEEPRSPKVDSPHQLRDLQSLQLAAFGSQLQAHFRHPAKTLEFSLIPNSGPILTQAVTREGTIRFTTRLGLVKVDILEIDWRKKEVTLRWRRESGGGSG